MEADVAVKQSNINWQRLATTHDARLVQDVIAREDKNWRYTLMLIGLVQLVGSKFLDPGWGILLILIAAASLYFRSAAMFPVYGVTLAWAMVSNILTGQVQWVLLGLLQAYWALSTFQRFLVIRRAADRIGISLRADASAQVDRTASLFPWAGCVLAAAAPTCLVMLIILVVVSYGMTGQEPSGWIWNLTTEVTLNSALLGLALGVAALLARFRRRLASVLAVVGSGLMLGTVLLIAFASWFVK